MAKKDNTWMYIAGGIVLAVAGYYYITSQKAGANGVEAIDADAEANVAHTGCGCGAH